MKKKKARHVTKVPSFSFLMIGLHSKCRRGDSNPLGLAPTGSLSQRVYQFHHFGGSVRNLDMAKSEVNAITLSEPPHRF